MLTPPPLLLHLMAAAPPQQQARRCSPSPPPYTFLTPMRACASACLSNPSPLCAPPMTKRLCHVYGKQSALCFERGPVAPSGWSERAGEEQHPELPRPIIPRRAASSSQALFLGTHTTSGALLAIARANNIGRASQRGAPGSEISSEILWFCG